MLERIKDVLRNRKAEGDKGFSLVELAVVIAVIGILVAIAVPVFANMQASARTATAQAAAANGSSMAAAQLASGGSLADPTFVAQLDALADGDGDVTDVEVTSGTTLSDYCVTATYSGGTETKGPGCPTP